MPVFGRGKSKSDGYFCKIYTMDAELQFTIDATAKGHTLFSLVCQTMGLRESWYFGLKYLDKTSQEWNWLQMNRTILSQPLQISSHRLPSASTENSKVHLLRSLPAAPSTSTINLLSPAGSQPIKGTIEFHFVVKFYPEDITHELIQDLTRRLFYRQVKQDILNMDLYCPPDTAAHLASLALQAKFGDYAQLHSSAESINLENEALLPLSCFQKIELSRSDWFEQITSLWRTHASLTREEAEMSYLKHAQDLDMFGLAFFEISKMQGAHRIACQPTPQAHESEQIDLPAMAAELWLGIDALGIRFYKKNKLRPEVFFSWSDIKNISVHEKKVILNLLGDRHATFAFYTSKSSTSREILDLAIGNHQLYIKRRQEQSIEMQQMKYFEERQQKDRRKTLMRERQLRIEAEQQRSDMQEKLENYQEQMKEIHQTLSKYQEAAELLARKVHLSSEEARSQAAKAMEVETQLERCKYEMNRNEEEKRLFTRKISECEQLISTLVNDSVKNRKEADELKLEVAKWRVAEAAAREKLLAMTQLAQTPTVANAQSRASTLSPPPYRPISRVQQANETDKQLQDLKNVLQARKIEERQTPLDKAYEENLAGGDNKYSTMQKARSGTALKRMAMLQDL